MNTLSQKNLAEQICINTHQRLTGLILGTVLTSLTMTVSANESYYHNVLFKPDKSILKAEARGNIMIYDGLENEVVEQALDEQFERIDHMMFIGIRHTQPDGEVNIDDDGC